MNSDLKEIDENLKEIHQTLVHIRIRIKIYIIQTKIKKIKDTVKKEFQKQKQEQSTECLNGIDNQNNQQTEEYYINNTNSFKSYMPYQAITDTESSQYQLQQYAITNEYGIREVDGRYLVAIGTYFNVDVGTYIDLILANGEVIECIVGDIKDNRDTLSDNTTTASNGCVSEFICNTNSLNIEVKSMGDISYVKDEWNSPVTQIKVYDENALK